MVFTVGCNQDVNLISLAKELVLISKQWSYF